MSGFDGQVKLAELLLKYKKYPICILGASKLADIAVLAIEDCYVDRLFSRSINPLNSTRDYLWKTDYKQIKDFAYALLNKHPDFVKRRDDDDEHYKDKLVEDIIDKFDSSYVIVITVKGE